MKTLNINSLKKLKKIIGIDLFDEKTLLNHPTDNIPSLNLSKKKQKVAMSRQGLGILTSRASLYGTYLSIAFSLIMLGGYHHLSVLIPLFISVGLIASRVYMMRYFARYARWEQDFGKQHKFAIASTVNIVVNMIWLIAISILGGINLFGYLFAVIFCMMSVVSGFAHLIYFVRMNAYEVEPVNA